MGGAQDSDDLERARRLEAACDVAGASAAALAGGDAMNAARLACLARDDARWKAASEALAASGPDALARAAEELLARGYGASAGELFEQADAQDRAGAAYAAGGEPCRAALAF
ncbi:MAG TPA: hypothetical protein VL400_15885, partial [Polyangiaceae bacterium]|nr:hypothetical protein [Polyangiaceae bacterium]